MGTAVHVSAYRIAMVIASTGAGLIAAFWGMGFIYLMSQLPQERLGIAVNGIAMAEGAQ